MGVPTVSWCGDYQNLCFSPVYLHTYLEGSIISIGATATELEQGTRISGLLRREATSRNPSALQNRRMCASGSSGLGNAMQTSKHNGFRAEWLWGRLKYHGEMEMR